MDGNLKNLMDVTGRLAMAHNDLLTEYSLLKQIIDTLPYVVELVLEDCRLCGGCGESCWHEAKPGDKCDECLGTGKNPIQCEGRCQAGKRPTRNWGANGDGTILEPNCKHCDSHGYEITKVPIGLWVELWLEEQKRRGYHVIKGVQEMDGTIRLSIGSGLWYPIEMFYVDERTAQLLKPKE